MKKNWREVVPDDRQVSISSDTVMVLDILNEYVHLPRFPGD
jgi:hypothetical protein